MHTSFAWLLQIASLPTCCFSNFFSLENSLPLKKINSYILKKKKKVHHSQFLKALTQLSIALRKIIKIFNQFYKTFKFWEALLLFTISYVFLRLLSFHSRSTLLRVEEILQLSILHAFFPRTFCLGCIFNVWAPILVPSHQSISS